jgi:hypothetical protein
MYFNPTQKKTRQQFKFFPSISYQAKSVISDTNVLRKVITFGSPAKYHEILNKKAGGSLGGGDFGSGGGSGGKDFISSVNRRADAQARFGGGRGSWGGGGSVVALQEALPRASLFS